MIIDCVSDLHGHYPKLEGGDLLIVAGDLTAFDQTVQWAKFFEWLKKQDYHKKILIGGNHDNFMANGWPKSQKEAEELKEVQEFLDEQESDGINDFEYLCDSGTEFDGLKIWGSPWSLWFKGINPKCKAFTGSENDLQKKFSNIPTDVDILITHSPPWGIADSARDPYDGRAQHVGSKSLYRELIGRLQPKLHVFGHIHEEGGQQLFLKRPGFGTENNTRCVNASYVNERYEPVNKPIRIFL